MSRQSRRFRRMIENRELLQSNFFRALDKIDRSRKTDRHMPWDLRFRKRTPAPFHNGRKVRK